MKWRSQKGTSSEAVRRYGSGGPSGYGVGKSRTQNGREDDNARMYPLGEVTNGGKGKPDMYVSISPSESQEYIIGGARTDAQITASWNRNAGGSDDLSMQGITVTTDVKVVRG